jgi:hypothetical protein
MKNNNSNTDSNLNGAFACRDAIQSFLAVGFAPYRLRRIENGARVPEVLPLVRFTGKVEEASKHDPMRGACACMYALV